MMMRGWRRQKGPVASEIAGPSWKRYGARHAHDAGGKKGAASPHEASKGFNFDEEGLHWPIPESGQ